MSNELKSKQGGKWLALFQGTAYAAPAASVAAFFGSGAAEVGRALPLTYLIAVFGVLSAMYMNYSFAKKLRSAGGYFTFAYAGLGRKPAVFVGWMYYFYQIGTMAAFTALIFPAILYVYIPGLNSLTYGWLPISVIAIGIPFTFVWLGLKPSLYYTLIGSILEIGFILLMSFIIIHGAGSSNTLSVFSLNGNSADTLGFGTVYAILAFIGIGSMVTLTEEIDNSKKSIPWALVSAAIIIGITYVIAAYAQTVGWGASMASYGTATNPGIIEALKYGGPLLMIAFLVFISNSFISNAIAQANAMTRQAFGMAKHGVLFPKSFTEVDEKSGAPRKNLLFNYIIFIPIFLFFGIAFGPFLGGTILITIIAIGLYILHIVDNISLPMFSLRTLKNNFKATLPLILGPFPATIVYILAIYGSWSVFPPYPLLWAIWGSFISVGIGIILAFIYSKEKNAERTFDDLRRMAQEEETYVEE